MKIELEKITPAIARELLVSNTDNRPINKNHVAFLASQMKAGEWRITGEALKISELGRLLDGQHRLSAVEESGVVVEMFVARGVADDVFGVLDTGKVRTARDVIAIEGMKSANMQSSLARSLMSYYSGKLGAKTRAYTNMEVLNFCREHDLLPFVNYGVMLASKGAPLKAPVIMFLKYVLDKVDPVSASSFLNKVCLGIDVKSGSMEAVLREKLNKAISGRYNLEKWETIALVLKSWNIIRTGSEVPGYIIYNPDREKFPIAS